ncbi:hypothetical protein EON66_11205 [archaeon]|nr:MAG: hypothetical protein EON66_11205 [archaeon]
MLSLFNLHTHRARIRRACAAAPTVGSAVECGTRAASALCGDDRAHTSGSNVGVGIRFNRVGNIFSGCGS